MLSKIERLAAPVRSSTASALLALGVIAVSACVSAGDLATQHEGLPTSRTASHYNKLGLITEAVRIPASEGRYSIAVTIVRPAGPGPFGAVVLNHGVPVSDRDRLNESAAEDFKVAAAEFARRGYAVVMPMRRGFGATGGEFAEDAGPCSAPDYMKGENEAAKDVMAAYDYARTLPYVDAQRMILAGHSAGGMVAMFTAGMRAPEGLKAVLTFAAGRGGNPVVRPGQPCAVEPIAKMLEAVGKTISVPVLMHYAENDKYFGPAATALWHKRFIAAGAQAELVMQPEFGDDGHYVFGDAEGVESWLPVVERFLARHSIPFGKFERTASSAANAK